MFLSLPDTPFDLRFRLFRFPVLVRVWFWLTAALMGQEILRFGFQFLVLWMVCVFVSVLVHELGHGAFYRWFGHWCEIEFIAFFGLARADSAPAERRKRVAVSLAGPGFGFAFLGLLVLSDELTGWSRSSFVLALTYGFLYQMNLYWNLINLLPIWPLDGGKVCREACQASSVENPDAVAAGIGFFTAAGLTAVGVLAALNSLPPAVAASLPWWMIPSRMMTFFLIYFVVENYMMWQQAKQAGRWDRGYGDDREPWQR